MLVVSVELDQSSARVEELEALLQRMERQLATTSEKLTATSAQLASVMSERDKLRHAYRRLMEQFELLRRRIFVAKAERRCHAARARVRNDEEETRRARGEARR